MTSTDQLHATIVATALQQLCWAHAPNTGDYRQLAGGMSGSFVYEIRLGDASAILKVTLPASAREVINRARREAWFYEHLASRVPLRVPRLLAVDDDVDKGVVILMGAYKPAPPVSRWSEQQYADIAAQLGLLHGAFWDNQDGLGTSPWLRPEPQPPDPVRYRQAAKAWQELGEHEAFRYVVTAERLHAIQRLLARLPTLEQSRPSLSPTLCHGDCHAENLLLDPTGAWMWADWQSVHSGLGPDDLAFFCQRALVAGGTVPYETMLDVYRATLSADVQNAPSAEQIDQAMARAELASWLLEWPPYLAAEPVPVLDRVLTRIESIAQRNNSGPQGT